MDRSATDAIKGYFYQFDYSILNLLTLVQPEEAIQIECIEDIDIHTADDTTAIQCKYYAKTEYNHSVIKEPIMYMLTHFAEVKAGRTPSIKYFLTGYYKSGQDKLQLPIDVDFLKDNFLTYTRTEEVNKVKAKVTHYHHIELGLDDNDLNLFINQLKIDLNGQEFDAQYNSIIKALKRVFNCSEFSAEYFFYNNALRIIKDLAIKPKASDRLITQRTFLDKIDKKTILFNEWFIQIKGLKAHLAALRKEYFTQLNISPFERFFILETDTAYCNNIDLIEVIHLIAKKWSKLTQRETSPFCPYVFLKGVTAEKLIEIKTQLLNEGILINDGHPFLGSDFNTTLILKPANFQNGIKLKVLSTVDNISDTLNVISKRKEVYQFYLTEPFFNTTSEQINHIKIQINKISEIKQII
ncbi:hypothetical protein HDE69_004825 [Pedobacter cryoconitis]|uniref:Uncharacterized protein n=1 Tax=Pedobacter cryoconitis TaxID=188932 RepID=A0A7W9DLY7_9SPHI|nr:DUF4297 family anti-phage-associated protein [Pedobacter cryoconitis]MBB5623738.1 hypothetical protein [Pedobacter cryoconitis]